MCRGDCDRPLVCKKESPWAWRVVDLKDGWLWEHSWLIFTVWYMSLNIAYCLATVGPSTLMDIYKNASLQEVGLPILFSFLWGLGTMLYSIGIEMMGAGAGLAMIMSLVTVIGTFIPLLSDHRDELGSATALTVMGGIILGIVGFTLAAYSTKIREDASAIERSTRKSARKEVQSITVVATATRDAADITAGTSPPAASEGPEAPAQRLSAADKKREDFQSWAGPKHAAHRLAEGTARTAQKRRPWFSRKLASSKVEAEEPVVSPEADEDSDTSLFLVGVVVCATCSVFACMLQAALVFGADLVDIAEVEEGVPEKLAPNVVWFLAFSLSGLWNLVYVSWQISHNGTWSRFLSREKRQRRQQGDGEEELGAPSSAGSMQLPPGEQEEKHKTFLHRMLLITIASVFFLAHIHLYGIAQILFGDLGEAIGWPLLMTSTLLSGQAWSWGMKEFAAAPHKARVVNYVACLFLILAVTVIALAGTVV